MHDQSSIIPSKKSISNNYTINQHEIYSGILPFPTVPVDHERRGGRTNYHQPTGSSTRSPKLHLPTLVNTTPDRLVHIAAMKVKLHMARTLVSRLQARRPCGTCMPRPGGARAAGQRKGGVLSRVPAHASLDDCRGRCCASQHLHLGAGAAHVILGHPQHACRGHAGRGVRGCAPWRYDRRPPLR